MSVIIRRFFELVIMCMLFSFGISLLFLFNIISSIDKITIIFIVIYVVLNTFLMYVCYVFLMSKKLFYLYNYVAYLLFSAVTYILFDKKFYSIFFRYN